MTLILTTHDMHEAADLADRVGIMDHGKLLALDTPDALMRSLPGSDDAGALDHRDRRTARASAWWTSWRALPEVERAEPFDDGGALHVRLYLTGEAPPLVAPAGRGAGSSTGCR